MREEEEYGGCRPSIVSGDTAPAVASPCGGVYANVLVYLLSFIFRSSSLSV